MGNQLWPQFQSGIRERSIGREIKQLGKNLIFDGTSGLKSDLKLQMTSYSDNAYDVTNFGVF